MMGKKENFTAERVAAFKPEPGKQQSIYWDAKTPGLGLRVTAAGAKSYIFETRLHGKTIRLTIGDLRTWAIGKAQSKATEYKSLTDQGIDPRQQASEQRAKVEAAHADAKSKTALVSEAWDAYLAHQKDKMQHAHIERGKRWGARHLADHENLAQAGGATKKRGNGLTKPGVLYPLLQMRMGDITADTLKAWQRKEAETRANNARQGFEMFRAFWRWTASRQEFAGAIDSQAVEDKELRDEVPSRKSKRFDVLERGHLSAWFAAVRGLGNPVISAYLQALMLTGARREEMAALRWQDVDFQWGSIWIKDKVREEGRKVPLTPYLRSLLSALPRRNEWVFSSPTAKLTGGRLTEPRIPHNRALSVAGLPPLTLHGLRRTFASLAEWVEMPRGIVAQIMGHLPSATAEKHYIDRPLELLAVWHGKFEAWILEQAGIEFQQEQQGLRVVV
jgi:integrase